MAQTKTTNHTLSTPERQILPSGRLPVCGRWRCFDTALRIDQWQKSPLAETTNHSGRSREPAKVLRTERAGLERNKPLRYSAAGTPTSVGVNAVKPEHLSPLRSAAGCRRGRCNLRENRDKTQAGADHAPKTVSPLHPNYTPPRPEKMGLGEENRLRLSFPDSQDSIKKVTALSMTQKTEKLGLGEENRLRLSAPDSQALKAGSCC